MLDTVRIETRKWPDSPHWEFGAVRLGSDRHGVWCGIEAGTEMSRPTLTITAAADHVTLTPYDAWWLGTFYGDDPVRPFDTYVDIATPSVWQDGDRLVRAVDLDLDVIRGVTGRVWVDDEDEFAQHRVSLAYPEHVVEAAVTSCARIEAAVRAGEPPFDADTARGWLARFREQLRAGRS